MVKKGKDTSISLKPLTFNQAIRELAKAPKRKLEDYETGSK